MSDAGPTPSSAPQVYDPPPVDSAAGPGPASPASGAATPGSPAPAGAGAARSTLRAELRTGLWTLAVLVLCGAPLGLLWAAVAPRADLVQQGDSLGFADLETKDFIAADGLLFLLGVAAGVLAAVLAWRLGRHRPLGTLLGLVAGAGLASLVAWRTGIRIDDREALLAAARDPAGTRALDLPLALRSHAALLGWPAGGALTFALIALRRPQSLPE